MQESSEKKNKSDNVSRDLLPREEASNKKSIKRRVLIFLVIISVASGLILLSIWFFSKINFERPVKESMPASEMSDEQSQSEKSEEDVEEKEEIMMEEEEKADDTETMMVSENYKISQVKFGGDAIFLSNTSENIPLEIYDTRSETVSSKDGEEHKLMVVWKTNKLATSEIEYSESSGQNPKTFKRSDYGFDHSAILSDLEPATAYVYRIKAKDRWGNESASDYFGAYTGKKADSVFELVVKAIEEVFGWAMKK